MERHHFQCIVLYTNLVRNHNLELQSLNVRFSVWLDFIRERDLVIYAEKCLWANEERLVVPVVVCDLLGDGSTRLSSSQSVHMHPSTCMSAASHSAESVHEGEEDAIGLSGQSFGERRRTFGVDCMVCKEEQRVLIEDPFVVPPWDNLYRALKLQNPWENGFYSDIFC